MTKKATKKEMQRLLSASRRLKKHLQETNGDNVQIKAMHQGKAIRLGKKYGGWLSPSSKHKMKYQVLYPYWIEGKVSGERVNFVALAYVAVGVFIVAFWFKWLMAGPGQSDEVDAYNQHATAIYNEIGNNGGASWLGATDIPGGVPSWLQTPTEPVAIQVERFTAMPMPAD